MDRYGSYDPAHMPEIIEIGWGEPPQYHPSCSCGWKGIIIDTYPKEQIIPIPELKPLIEEYGEQVFREPNRAMGKKNDALKQVLIHIDYDPDLDSEYSLSEFNEVFENYSKKIKENDYKNALDLSKKLTQLNQELLNMENRIEVFKNHELTIPEFNAELYSKVEKITKEYRKKTFSIGKPGLLDND